jgi:hypothetical protein
MEQIIGPNRKSPFAVLQKKVRFWVDESEVSPGTVIVAVVSIDEDWYQDLLSGKVLDRKASRFYNFHGSEIHYADDDLSTRSDFAARVIDTAPVSAYFLIKETPASLDGMAAKIWTYRNAFPKLLLENILNKYQKLYDDGFSADIAFENLTNKPSSDLEFYKECVDSLGYPNVEVRVVGKEDPMVTLPDYFAGILRTFLTIPFDGGKGKEAKINIQFIQNSIGLIVQSKSDGKTEYFSRAEEVAGFVARYGG